MVRDVVFSNINNKITRLHVAIISLLINYFVVKKVKSGSSTGDLLISIQSVQEYARAFHKPVHLDICIHDSGVFLVLLCQREQGSANLEQVAHIGKVQPDERPPVSEQVVRKIEVFLVEALEALDQTLEGSPAVFLHFHLMASFDRNEEVWVIFHRGFETTPVVLQKVVVNTSAASWHIRVLY